MATVVAHAFRRWSPVLRLALLAFVPRLAFLGALSPPVVTIFSRHSSSPTRRDVLFKNVLQCCLDPVPRARHGLQSARSRHELAHCQEGGGGGRGGDLSHTISHGAQRLKPKVRLTLEFRKLG